MNSLKIHMDKTCENMLSCIIENSEYDCLAIKPSNCPKRLELIIDYKINYKNSLLIGKNTICFDDEIQNKVYEIFLKYENDTFLIKSIFRESKCKSCPKSCLNNTIQ